MALVFTLYAGNTTIFEVQSLTHSVDGTPINNATVTVELQDPDGAQVTGETWPLAMSYVSGSNGVYRATLPSTLVVTTGVGYTAIVKADDGSGSKGEWAAPVSVKVREA